MMKGSRLRNGVLIDPERMARSEAQEDKDGKSEDVVAILKGIRTETLDFDTGQMPLASANNEFSYEDPVTPTVSNPYSMGLVEAMLRTSDGAMPVSNKEQ